MIDPIDRFLIRQQFKGGLTPAQALAANVLWRDGETVSELARRFDVSRNTIYYKALTGEGSGYPQTSCNWASDINDLIELVGVEAIRRRREVREVLNARAA